MSAVLSDYYLWIKALHVVALISWMAGLLYLPRLFVYHAQAEPGSELSETLKIMERKLLRLIMNPAMIVTFITGFVMIGSNTGLMQGAGWLHAKITLVFLLAGFHGYLSVCRKKFLVDANTRSHKFYRLMNEVPTVLMILIVILVIVRPF